MLDINTVKNYIRADEDDDMVLSLIEASKSYMQGAVDDFDEKYANNGANWQSKADLAMKMLIADWYENRVSVGRPANASVTLLITQLQLEGVQNGS